ncbi:MAG: hypothetical protein IAG13_31785 [Deltaproteobacteria bacterium]|nr:hypothetical protein [Nannocystaceae bacterium]
MHRRSNIVSGVVSIVLSSTACAAGDDAPADTDALGSSSGGTQHDTGSSGGSSSVSDGPTTAAMTTAPETESADDSESDGGSSSDTGEPLPPDPCIAANTCPPGAWIEVTPPDLASLDFGPGPVVVDPRHPSDLYMGGGGDGIWKSSHYGNTWTRIDDTIGYVPMGLIIAVAGTEPATIWVAGYHLVHRSTDGGESFEVIEACGATSSPERGADR